MEVTADEVDQWRSPLGPAGHEFGVFEILVNDRVTNLVNVIDDSHLGGLVARWR